jgi:methionyl-tRNA formyltransferase
MRIILFLNNWAGWQAARWLRQRNEEIVGLVVQPPDDRRFADEIISALNLPPERVWTADKLRDNNTLAELKQLRPDIGISVFFCFLLKPDVINLFPRGCINLHAALLPLNRGWHTNVWPIIDCSPAGVTIHYIDPGVDTGDIIAQEQIPVEITDTGGSLHEKIVCAEVELFKKTWPSIREGENARTPQDNSKATSHRKAAIKEIDCIDLDRRYRASDLINILRARTYPPYPSAYYMENNERRYVRVDLRRQDQLQVSEAALRSFPQANLETEYLARELIGLLRSDERSPDHFVKFAHPSGAFFAQCYVVDEREFDPSGSPRWMSERSLAFEQKMVVA